MAEHNGDADVDGARPLVESHPQMLSWQKILMKQMWMEPHPWVENHPWMLFCLLNLRACYWHLHCSRSQETCSSGGTPPVTSMPVLGERAPHNWSIMFPYPKECSLVFQPSWLSAGIEMPSSTRL